MTIIKQPESLPPLISIIITCYNYEGFLSKAIDSVLYQDYPNIELIVVDDCSTDSSRDIIRSYGKQVIPVFHDINQGHGGAFNNGYARSSGMIIMFLDADDFLLPNSLSKAINALSSDTGMCQFRMYLVNAQGEQYDIFPKPEVDFDNNEQARNKLLYSGEYQSTVTSGLMFHKKYLSQVMPMPAESFRQGADGYLVTLAPLYTAVTSSSVILSAYRQHGENHSGFASELMKRAHWRVQHHAMRHQVLKKAAEDKNLLLRDNYWLNDSCYLRELMCLKLFYSSSDNEESKSSHKLSRLGLMYHAVKNLQHINLSLSSQVILTLWWLLITVLPASLARPIFSWNVLASTRPKFVQKISSVLRRI